MRVERRLERRDELLKLVQTQAGEIEELGWAVLHVREPSMRHRWCLLQGGSAAIIGITSILLPRRVWPFSCAGLIYRLGTHL